MSIENQVNNVMGLVDSYQADIDTFNGLIKKGKDAIKIVDKFQTNIEDNELLLNEDLIATLDVVVQSINNTIDNATNQINEIKPKIQKLKRALTALQDVMGDEN